MKFNLGLIALAVGAFGIGVTEFAPMGMLPVIAGDRHVSIPAAGLLISAYAMGVLIGAPLLTLTTGRIDRRTLLIALMGIFTLGNALSAMAGGYWMLMAARVVTSFNHGAFFGVGVGGRRQPRAAGQARGRGGGDVHRADRCHDRRRAGGDLGQRGDRLAHCLCRDRRGWRDRDAVAPPRAAAAAR
jgi:hypothetical protein